VALHAAGPATFTYGVPADAGLAEGHLVVAPLGPRHLVGVIVRLHAEQPPFPTRPIEAALYPAPLLARPELDLARWMARVYRASVWDCACLLLPPGLAKRLSSKSGSGFERLTHWLDGLMGDGGAEGRADRPGGAVTDRDAATENSAGDAGRQRQAAGEGAARSVLTPAQARALTPMLDALRAREPAVFLLHGVTGSGKTHVYLSAAERVIAAGGQVLVLVSEIALTPEAAERFSARFPGRVEVLHSALSAAQRDRAWSRIYSGQVGLVVGARSAVFAPARRLGLVVVDEEHEWTYKQDQSPRYHARSVAIARGRTAGACVVLSSATPDVASYYHAERGRFRLLELPDRWRGRETPPSMPAVEIVDMRRELREGNRSIFSRALTGALVETLERREQAILFLNRRGAATCVTCRDCGHTLQCRRCEVPLAMHRGVRDGRAERRPASTDELVCHRCNRRRPVLERCPKCASPRISALGIGTQRVEQEVRGLLPEARVERWDQDAVTGRGAHQERWRAFAEGRVDVLIGTQMVAKALDVANVTLVGAVLADSGLYLPDFRAAERTFQLLTQVAGRAGRGPLAGRAIIQTYSPDHYAIQAAARHDYAGFYAREISFRRQFGYPPFRRLARLVFSHSNETRCWRETMRARRLIAERVRALDIGGLETLGPVPCFHRRVRGRYRWQLLLLGDRFDRLLDELPLSPGWTVDVEPASVL
jgi:primosomal protein N' (replication factor Y)